MTQEEFIKRYTYSPSRDRIGGGGFGTVYKAKDNLLHRTVAIKVSVVKTTADGKKTFSLKDEFEALNHVPKHPNIANYEEFYSFESPQGLFDYAVMQFYPDGNLSNAIKQGLTAEQKEDIAKQLLEGISFLHKHNVVHRDLKPGNILIVKEGDKVIPLITDFGLSKSTGVIDGSVFSNSFGAGTPRYSSPEQLQGEPLRFNTDLWSFGAIIYELFTGEQLFSAGSGAANTAQADLEIYNKIVNGNVSGLGIMPEKWRKVAERCLVVDAAKRAKNVEELFGVYNDNGCGTPKDTSSTFIQNNVTMVNPPIVNDEIRMENQTSSSVAKKSVVDRTVCIISNNKGIWWKQAVALSLLSLVFAGLFGVFLSDSDMNGFIVFAGCLICLLLLSAYLWVHVLLFRWLSKKVKVMHWVLAFFSVFLIVFGLLSDFYFGIVVCFFAVVVSTAGLLVYRPEKLKFLPYLVIAILGFLFIYFLMTDNQNIDNDNRFICFMGALSTIVYFALIILMTIKDRKVMKSPLKQDT